MNHFVKKLLMREFDKISFDLRNLNISGIEKYLSHTIERYIEFGKEEFRIRGVSIDQQKFEIPSIILPSSQHLYLDGPKAIKLKVGATEISGNGIDNTTLTLGTEFLNIAFCK